MTPIDSDVEEMNKRYSIKARGSFGKFATVATAFVADTLTLSGRASGGAGGASSSDSSATALSGGKVRVGVAMPAQTSERWITDGDAMKGGLETAGYEVDLRFTNDDIPTQTQQIDQTIASGATILVIAFIDGTALSSQLDIADSENILVIAYDRPIHDSENVDFYVSSDNFKAGVTQGNALLYSLGLTDRDGKKLDSAPKGPLNTKLFVGSSDDDSAKFFFGGAMNVLKLYPGDGTLVVESGQTSFDQVVILRWQQEAAQEHMEDLLTSTYGGDSEPLASMLSPFGDISHGITTALQGAGYDLTIKGGLPIVIGQDAEIASAKMINDGIQQSTIFKDTRTLIAQAVTVIRVMAENKGPEANDTTTYNNGVKVMPSYLLEVGIIYAGNLREKLIDSGYFIRVDIDAGVVKKQATTGCGVLAPHPTPSDSKNANMARNILEMRDTDKGFNDMPVLRHVNLDACPGEVHALCSENDAGKSTLMEILFGVYSHGQYDGTIIFGSKKVQLCPIKNSEVLGIGITHQELTLIPYLSIAENIFLDAEKPREFGLIDWHEVSRHTEEVLKKTGLNESMTTQVGTLGMDKQQLIEIGKALSKDARLLILDEPTAALDGSDSAQLLDLVRSLRDQSVVTAITSHKLDEITEIADRTTILRNGQTADTIDTKDSASMQGKVISLVVGHGLTQRYPERSVEIGEEVSRVEDWTVYHPIRTGRIVTFGASFNVRHGEAVGIVGLMGAGRTELVMSILGRSFGTCISGRLLEDDKEITIKSVPNAIEHDIAYATEDRKRYGLNLIDDIRHSVATADLFRFSRRGLVGGYKELAVAADYRERMNIRSNSILQKTGSLSGGNQQKIVLSKRLYTDADVLIPDEPTRGINIGVRFEIYTPTNRTVEEGKTVIVISSELEEAFSVSDRIHTLTYSRIIGEVKAEDTTQENLMELMATESAREEQK